VNLVEECADSVIKYIIPPAILKLSQPKFMDRVEVIFTGIGNRAPDMSTWDKATMEVDYIRTSDDQTVPDAPPSTCMDNIVCDSDSCASCEARVDWLMANRGKSRSEATQQVANEFPDKCNCSSDCRNNMACSGSSCYTCGERIEWLEANEGMTKTQATQRVEQEFPADCKCGVATLLASPLELPEENSHAGEEDAQSTAIINLSLFEFVAALGAILFCCALAALCAFKSRKEDMKEATLEHEMKDVTTDEGQSEMILTDIQSEKILTEIFEEEM